MTDGGPVVRLFETVHADHQATIDRVLKSYSDGTDHHYKMLTLAAAMAGFGVPLIGGQKAFVNVVILRHAMVWLWVAVFIGIVIVVAGRWLFVVQIGLLYREFNRQTGLIGKAGDDPTRLAQAMSEIESGAKPLLRKLARMMLLAGLGDLLFYSAILVGIVEIGRAVLKG